MAGGWYPVLVKSIPLYKSTAQPENDILSLWQKEHPLDTKLPGFNEPPRPFADFLQGLLAAPLLPKKGDLADVVPRHRAAGDGSEGKQLVIL